MKNRETLVGCVLGMLLYGCAQIGVPTGGEKDVFPPRDTLSLPPNYSVHFRSPQIKIKFNEFIVLKNVADICMYPLPEKKPEVFTQGKWLYIKFKSPLQPNTTYQIHFNKVIADLNEGNELDHFVYVFSTGPALDTGRIQGNIVDIRDLSPARDVIVYFTTDTLADSLLLRGKYEYAVSTDKQGHFELSYLPATYFRVFAIQDRNKNGKVEHDEMAGFISDPVLSLHNENITLEMFPVKPSKLYVTNRREVSAGRYLLLLNRKVDSLIIDPLFQTQSNFFYRHSGDSVWVYFSVISSSDYETKNIVLKQQDRIIDTIPLKFSKDVKGSMKLTIEKSPVVCWEKKAYCIYADYPIVQIDTAAVFLQPEKDPNVSIPFNLIMENPYTVRLVPSTGLTQSLKLICKRGAFAFAPFIVSDSVNALLPAIREKDFASLEIDLRNIEASYLLELYDQNKMVSRVKVSKDEKVSYYPLSEGSYTLMLVRDDNHNGQWDTGEIYPLRQPEKRFRYKGEINLKKGWIQEIVWDLKK